jgi:hypothetical protein
VISRVDRNRSCRERNSPRHRTESDQYPASIRVSLGACASRPCPPRFELGAYPAVHGGATGPFAPWVSGAIGGTANSSTGVSTLAVGVGIGGGVAPRSSTRCDGASGGGHGARVALSVEPVSQAASKTLTATAITIDEFGAARSSTRSSRSSVYAPQIRSAPLRARRRSSTNSSIVSPATSTTVNPQSAQAKPPSTRGSVEGSTGQGALSK